MLHYHHSLLSFRDSTITSNFPQMVLFPNGKSSFFLSPHFLKGLIKLR